MRKPMSQCYSMNKRGTFFLFFIALLLGCLSLFTEYVSAEEAQQEAEGNNEKIISVLQKGIGLLKYEIQRDQKVASRKKLDGRRLRNLRNVLKKDIEPKEQLIKNLQSFSAEKLSGEIESLQRTFNEEKKIVNTSRLTQRVGRITRNTIKGLIPIKEQVLASFENFLSEIQ